MNILCKWRQLKRITLGLSNKIKGVSAKACTNIKISIHFSMLKRSLDSCHFVQGAGKWYGLKEEMEFGELKVTIERGRVTPKLGLSPVDLDTPKV